MRTLLISLLLLPIFALTGCNTTDPGEAEFNKGIEAERYNKLDLAQQLFEQALQKNPTLAEAHINLGLIFIKKKNVDRAWEETMKGLEIINETKTTIVMGGTWQEQASLAYNNLAKIVFDKAIAAYEAGDNETMKQHKDHALSLLQQAVEISSKNELAASSLAYIQRWPNE